MRFFCPFGKPRNKTTNYEYRTLATVLISTLRSLTNRAIWGWARQEATANLCLGTRAAVQEKVGDFFVRLSSRREESQTPLLDRAASTSGKQ